MDRALHGCRLFPKDRVPAVLATIERLQRGPRADHRRGQLRPADGSPIGAESKIGFYGQYTMFTPELLVLGHDVRAGSAHGPRPGAGRRYWANLCLVQRHHLRHAHMIHGQTGERLFGTDYYQNMNAVGAARVLAGREHRGRRSARGRWWHG